MKKITIILIVLVGLVSLLPGLTQNESPIQTVFAGTPVAPTPPEEKSPEDIAKEDEKRLADLNARIAKRNSEMKTLESELASPERTRSIEDIQDEINDLKSLNSLEEEQAKELEPVVNDRKIAAIEKKYNELLTANQTKQNELNVLKERCDSEDQKPKQCLNINERISANNLYMDTLLLKEDLEKCKIDESYCTTTKEELQGQIAALTSELAKTVRIMAENEQMINKGETFEVTDMFNPYPRDSEGIPERPVTKRLQTVTDTIATWMITLVSSFAVVALIIGGFMMIISGGDETRLELGKTIFTYSLIGLLVTLLAYGIVSSIQSLFYS